MTCSLKHSRIRTTHHRDDDAARALVEHVLDLPRRAAVGACARGGDADERAGRVGPEPSDRGDGLPRAGVQGGHAVLAVDDEPGEVRGRGGGRARVECAGEREPGAEGGLGGAEGM